MKSSGRPPNRFFLPVVQAYNRKFGTPYRVRVESPEQTLPRLSPTAQKAFDAFAGGANVRALHPYDWQRFYRFVRVSHAARNDLSDLDLAFFLRKAGFASDYAMQLAEIYGHCRNFYIQSDSRRELSYRQRMIPPKKSK